MGFVDLMRPILICIDVEPDPREIKGGAEEWSATVSFDRLLAGTDPLMVCVCRGGDLREPSYAENFNAFLVHLSEHPRRSEFRFLCPGEALTAIGMKPRSSNRG